MVNVMLLIFQRILSAQIRFWMSVTHFQGIQSHFVVSQCLQRLGASVLRTANTAWVTVNCQRLNRRAIGWGRLYLDTRSRHQFKPCGNRDQMGLGDVYSLRPHNRSLRGLTCIDHGLKYNRDVEPFLCHHIAFGGDVLLPITNRLEFSIGLDVGYAFPHAFPHFLFGLIYVQRNSFSLETKNKTKTSCFCV